MILERMKSDSMFMTQKIRFRTELFGREYFWLEDVDGTTYLAKAVPRVVGRVVGPDGTERVVTDGMIPSLI